MGSRKLSDLDLTDSSKSGFIVGNNGAAMSLYYEKKKIKCKLLKISLHKNAVH